MVECFGKTWAEQGRIEKKKRKASDTFGDASIAGVFLDFFFFKFIPGTGGASG